MMIIAGMLFGLALTALLWPLLPERPRLSLAALPGAPGRRSPPAPRSRGRRGLPSGPWRICPPA